MASLRFRFDNADIDQTFTARPYKPEPSGWDNLVFEPFPTSDVLVITGDPYTKDHNRGRGRIPYEIARTWGDIYQMTSAIYFEAYTDSGREHKKYAVKVAFNVEKITDKYTASFEGLQFLTADTKFYGKHLYQYDVAPKHYGLWRAETEGWAGVMLFTVMEWGGYSWHELKGTAHDTIENRIRIGRTVEALHDFNLYHGTLHSNHHILYDPDLGRCLLVDFSRGRKHRCKRNLPILPTDAGYILDMKCDETLELSFEFGFLDIDIPPTPDTKTWKAIRFIKRYRSLFPRLSNTDALLVQRRHFFDDLPLFSEEFGFDEDGAVVFIPEDPSTETQASELTERLSEDFIYSLLTEDSGVMYF